MRYHTSSLPDGTLVSSELQELFRQAAVQAHLYGCRKQHGSPYYGYTEMRNSALRRSARELGEDRTLQVLVALAHYEMVGESHPAGSALCAAAGWSGATTDPAFPASGLNANLLELLS